MATFAKLRARDSYKLLKFIESEYTNLGKSDKEFADIATKALGIVITQAAVSHRRNELGIKSYLDTVKEKRIAEQNERQQQKLEKDRLCKQAARQKGQVAELNQNVLIIQRLDMLLTKVEQLCDMWKVK